MRIALCLILVPLTALADEPMSGAEFDAYTSGRTVIYSDGSGPYGAEEYYGNRQVRWSVMDGECIEGEWFEDDHQICFVYDGIAGQQCWEFFETSHGLRARFLPNDNGLVLYESGRSGDPLFCKGPLVGA